MDELRSICEDITDNKELFFDIAKQALILMLRQAVDNEESSNDYTFDEGDVTKMVNFMIEQLEHMTKVLTGKSRGCRFSPKATQFAYSLWDASPAQFRASTAILPLYFPGERQCKRIKQRNKCEDGEDVKTYQILASQKKTDEIWNAML